jgi:hypothetical protein
MSIYPGNLLTATAASVAGSPTPVRTWQWLRNGTAIGGATASTYTVVNDDVGSQLSVQQTETNFLGARSATSALTATVEVSLIPANAIFDRSGSEIRDRSNDIILVRV